jgi:hypothetical protein
MRSLIVCTCHKFTVMFRSMKMTRKVRHVALIGKIINAYAVLDGESEGKGPLSRGKRQDNIKIDDSADWVHLAQGRFRQRNIG